MDHASFLHALAALGHGHAFLDMPSGGIYDEMPPLIYVGGVHHDDDMPPLVAAAAAGGAGSNNNAPAEHAHERTMREQVAMLAAAARARYVRDLAAAMLASRGIEGAEDARYVRDLAEAMRRSLEDEGAVEEGAGADAESIGEPPELIPVDDDLPELVEDDAASNLHESDSEGEGDGPVLY